MEEGGGEVVNFIKVWTTVVISLCYCYGIRNKGIKKLIFVFPVVCLFLYLPLNLSSPHLGGTTAFFIAWLANFKLLLFAFGKGPLSLDPSISLPLFVAVACLPIKVSPNSTLNHTSSTSTSTKIKDGFLSYALKGFIVAILVNIYKYSDFIHPKIIFALYAFHIYFLLEINLAISAALARTLLGIELEPQFNHPYLATSLQDFWGKRWNLMVTGILRPTVYDPIRNVFKRLCGRDCATLVAVFATFVASAIMHELMFYYLGRVTPTWEITAFFLLHGFCVTAEIVIKKAFKGKLQLPGILSGMFTVVFVFATANWLFFPKFAEYQIDVRAFEDYAAIGAFMRQASERVLNLCPGHPHL
ncbi:acyl-CoA--sterol O-acyltransferase 1-like [Euphorbia lathyris]|uniref:acyl-CoA--sterol O-acyltransferase 1-like n=1 Tax=Euphorbia lathyris TaxID=212925 RepID=UPI003313C985